MRKRLLAMILTGSVLVATVAPAGAGSLLVGREETRPSDGSGVLEKVCVSTTEHGDAVTHADAGALATSASEDCSS